MYYIKLQSVVSNAFLSQAKSLDLRKGCKHTLRTLSGALPPPGGSIPEVQGQDTKWKTQFLNAETTELKLFCAHLIPIPVSDSLSFIRVLFV